MNSKPLVETAFTELPDGTLLDTIEYIHQYPADSTCGYIDLAHLVNLRLMCDGESSTTSPHQVGRVLTSFGFIDRKRTNTGYILVLSRDTRERIHKLMRRYAIEPDNSVNRDTCYFCIGWHKQIGLVPQNTSQSDGMGRQAK